VGEKRELDKRLSAKEREAALRRRREILERLLKILRADQEQGLSPDGDCPNNG
jgi:hypothetical protein